MKKILIIGACGYIGSFLYKNLNNYIVSGIDINSNNDEIIQMHSNQLTIEDIEVYDIIIYLGGYSGHVQCNNKDDVYEVNVQDLYNLSLKMNSNQLLIYASSSGLLEESGKNPANEDYTISSTLPPYTNSMKLREEKMQSPDIKCICIGLRFGTVIGVSPTQRTDLVYISMIRDIFLKGYINVVNPECYRGILWNWDLLRAFKKIIDNVWKPSVYNLSSFDTCIAKIANDLASKTSATTKFIHSENNTLGFSVDSSKFKKEYNFHFNGSHEVIVNELLNNVEYLCSSITKVSEKSKCRVCKSDNMSIILDLKQQPLANDYSDIKKENKTFPLCLIRCRDCNHTQLNYTVPPEDMFSNYSYNSGVSNTLKEYFKFIYNKCEKEVIDKNKIVIELACNDGTQLDVFKENGWKTIGIDPATNLVKLAENNGHKIYNIFWGNDPIPVDLETPSCIIAQNVLAHVPDPVLFLKSCRKIMNSDTLLYVQTSQCNMYLNGEFDTVYHEHLSYFTLSSMMKCCELSDLQVVDVVKTSIHGTSYLFTIRTIKTRDEIEDNNVDKLYSFEKISKLYTDFFYTRYNSRVNTICDWVRNKINKLKDEYDIICYGAAAKGMTLLNTLNIHSDIKYIVDDATMKHNKYTSSNIFIYPTQKLTEITKKTVIIILAWNFSEEIIQNIKKYVRDDILIMIPFPEQKIINLSNNEIVDENHMKQIEYPLVVKEKVVLLSHFYNEEVLLPFWIRQHSPLFDSAILIDYDSNDKSLEIIKREAPSSWKVVSSRNRDFGAINVDKEVMDIEDTLPKNNWKLCLNTTEFISCPNLRNILNDVPNNVNVYQFVCGIMTGNDNLPLHNDTNLLEQRSIFGLDVKDTASYRRFMHRNRSQIYETGRHVVFSNYEVFTKGFLCKYLYTPWPMVLNRKLQISNRIPMSDKMIGLGAQNYYSEEKVKEVANEAKNKTQLDIKKYDTTMESNNVKVYTSRYL